MKIVCHCFVLQKKNMNMRNCGPSHICVIYSAAASIFYILYICWIYRLFSLLNRNTKVIYSAISNSLFAYIAVQLDICMCLP